MYRSIQFLAVVLLFLCSCSSLPKNAFSPKEERASIDYSDLDVWAAHPAKLDWGDEVPGMDNPAEQNTWQVDIFFIHPTTYRGRNGKDAWNARIDDEKVNERTDKSTIKFQASLFNQVGRLYAPRYRQAHLHVFYTGDKVSGTAALDFAYQDVKNSFEYYLTHENNGRPMIIASHSQGTVHAKRLLKEYFDGTALQEQLVAAYLVGMPVEEDYFDQIEVCQSPLETQCFCSWRTFQKDFLPSRHLIGDSIAVTNPLTWTTSEDYAEKELHKGAVLRNFDKTFSKLVDAQIYKGILWVSKPKFPWSFLFRRKNYHVADFNFFYFDVQENAKLRVANFNSP